MDIPPRSIQNTGTSLPFLSALFGPSNRAYIAQLTTLRLGHSRIPSHALGLNHSLLCPRPKGEAICNRPRLICFYPDFENLRVPMQSQPRSIGDIT